jgi:hypothetical protein
VNAVRALNAEIAALMEQSGINQHNTEIEALKAELLPLTQQYREVMGSNWQDESGYARYNQPGERRSYKIESVDEAFAGLINIQSQMDNLANDAPITFSGENFQNLTVPRLVGNEDVTEGELREVLAELEKMHVSTVQELRFQIENMREVLNKLAAGRNVSPVKEHVSIK